MSTLRQLSRRRRRLQDEWKHPLFLPCLCSESCLSFWFIVACSKNHNCVNAIRGGNQEWVLICSIIDYPAYSMSLNREGYSPKIIPFIWSYCAHWERIRWALEIAVLVVRNSWFYLKRKGWVKIHIWLWIENAVIFVYNWYCQWPWKIYLQFKTV